MKRSERLSVIAAAAVLSTGMITVFPVSAGAQTVESTTLVSEFKAEKKGGWKERDGKKYYVGKDGKPVTGWKTIGDKKYYFGKDGAMRTGKIKINGKTYDLGEDGALKSSKSSDSSSATKKKSSKKVSYSWGMSKKEIKKLLGGTETMETNNIIATGDTKKVTYYVFDNKGKLQATGNTASGNTLSTAKKTVEKAGYTELITSNMNGMDMTIYSRGDEMAVVAYAEQDGNKLTVTMYLSPSTSTNLMNGDSSLFETAMENLDDLVKIKGNK